MDVRARLTTQDGRVHEMTPGCIIGRSPMAALHIPDPRVSEAHALLSLREGGLRLLALRRRLTLHDAVVEEVVLEEGQVIGLAPGVSIEVLELLLPAEVLALEGDGLPRQFLPEVASFNAGDPPRLKTGYAPDADLLFWRVGSDVLVRAAGVPDRSAHSGDSWKFPLRGPGEGQAGMLREIRLVDVPLAARHLESTLPSPGRKDALRIVARWETVHVQRGGATVLVFDGVQARILSELAQMRVPVHWATLAAEVWPEPNELAALRGRLDVALTRLRKKLRDAGLPPRLVRTNGCGQLELMLAPDDVVVDET